jgi:hypothetical protein
MPLSGTDCRATMTDDPANAGAGTVGLPMPPPTAFPPNRDHRARAHCGKGLPHYGATTVDAITTRHDRSACPCRQAEALSASIG